MIWPGWPRIFTDHIGTDLWVNYVKLAIWFQEHIWDALNVSEELCASDVLAWRHHCYPVHTCHWWWALWWPRHSIWRRTPQLRWLWPLWDQRRAEWGDAAPQRAAGGRWLPRPPCRSERQRVRPWGGGEDGERVIRGHQVRFNRIDIVRTHTHRKETHTECIIATASTGNSPLAVSPDNITQSAPSSTALATSLPSALVGRGWATMLSSICTHTQPHTQTPTH